MDIGVITNPHARKNKLRPGHADELARVVGDAGVVAQTRHLEEIKPALRTFLREDCKYIAVDGGDGALHWVLRSALEVLQEEAFMGKPLPPLLPTRGGTIDFVAQNVGITGNAQTLLAMLRAQLSQGHGIDTTDVDTMRIDAHVKRANGELAPLRTYGFAVAAGGIGQRFFAKYYQDEDPNPRTIVRVVGNAIAALPVAYTALRHVPPLAHFASHADIFTPTKARVSIDGVTLPGSAFTGINIASMSINLGGVFRFFRKADAPGVMTALIGAPAVLGVVRNLPRMALGKDITGRDVIDRECQELVVTATGGELLAPIIDGEYYRDIAKIEFHLGPKIAIARLAAPAAAAA